MGFWRLSLFLMGLQGWALETDDRRGTKDQFPPVLNRGRINHSRKRSGGGPTDGVVGQRQKQPYIPVRGFCAESHAWCRYGLDTLRIEASKAEQEGFQEAIDAIAEKEGRLPVVVFANVKPA